MPFVEDFESYRPGDTPRYFSDQKGTFEVCRWPQGGLCLAQIVPAQGILWGDNWLLKPHTLFGDQDWQDCAIEADVRLAGGDVEIGGRYADRNKLGYRWILARDGRWQMNWQYTSLAAGQVENFDPAAWHHLRLTLKADQIRGDVDGRQLAAVTDKSRSQGMAFLASTYDRNLFDNIRVKPATEGRAVLSLDGQWQIEDGKSPEDDSGDFHAHGSRSRPGEPGQTRVCRCR